MYPRKNTHAILILYKVEVLATDKGCTRENAKFLSQKRHTEYFYYYNFYLICPSVTLPAR